MEELHQAVYGALKRAILDHRLPPGTKLTEEKLSAVFGVSRERVRKVLQRLSYDRCVDLKPNRGAFVAEPGVDEAHDVFAARDAIESHILELVGFKASSLDFESLKENIENERMAHFSGALNEAIVLSGEFHLLLARLAGNRVLEEILRDLIARSSLIIAMYGENNFTLCGYEEHLEILKRLKDGQTARAKKLLKEHLDGVSLRLRFEDRFTREIDLAEVFQGEKGSGS